MDISSFIHHREKVFSEDFCDNLIDLFKKKEQNQARQRCSCGETGSIKKEEKGKANNKQLV